MDTPERSAAAYSPLMRAVIENKLEAVKFLIERKAAVDRFSLSGATPLVLACSGGFDEIAASLLDGGANVNLRARRTGKTPLVAAAGKNHANCVKLLLSRKADTKLRSRSGETALDIAKKLRLTEIVSLLTFTATAAPPPAPPAPSPYFEIAAALPSTAVNFAAHAAATTLVAESADSKASTSDDSNRQLQVRPARSCFPAHSLLQFAAAAAPPPASLVPAPRVDSSPAASAASHSAGPLVDGADNKAGSPPSPTPAQVALKAACRSGDIEAIRVELAKDSIDLDDSTGLSYLQSAAFSGQLEAVKLIVAHKATVDKPDEKGYTALHRAAFRGHARIVAFLLDHGASLESRNTWGDTALTFAAKANRHDCVKVLLERKADSSAKVGSGVNQGQTALDIATRKRYGAVESLLQFASTAAPPPAPPAPAPRVDEPAAASAAPAACAASSLSAAASLSTSDEKSIALPAPAESAAPAPEPAAQPSSSQGALLAACESGDITALQAELAKGNVDLDAPLASPPLTIAAFNGKLEALKLLLAHKATIDRPNSTGYTALHRAVSAGHVDIASCLIDQGANLEGRNMLGATPLLIAARAGRIDCVKLLLERKANAAAANRWNHTALDIAKERQLADIASLLRFATTAAPPPAPPAPRVEIASLASAASESRESRVVAAPVAIATADVKTLEIAHQARMQVRIIVRACF